MVVGPMLRFIGATLVAIAAFALVMSWHNAPQRLIDAKRAERYTVHKDARIVESWVALDFDPSAMGTSAYWNGFAKWRPCVVVEYDADWGPDRRGFCGPRYGFIEKTRFAELRELSPGVPFDFARDGNGFRVPQVRMAPVAWDYLAGHPAVGSFKDFTALEELRRDLDRPVDGAIVSWSSPPPVFGLAIDPEHPRDPLPAGHIAARRNAQGEWLPGILATVVGLGFWWVGMNLLLAHLPFAVRMAGVVLPLLALPWWAEELPKALRHINRDVATSTAEALGDITAAGSMWAGDPATVPLRDGKPVLLGVADGVYADTIGRLRFTPPPAAPATADAALAALIDATARQVRAMSAPERTGMFERLRRDVADRRPYAGLPFLRAGKEALLDPASPPPLQAAAREFLSDWVMTAEVRLRRDDLAFEQKMASVRELLDVPVNVIAFPASVFLENVQNAPRSRRR
jgi:hypothetical protein